MGQEERVRDLPWLGQPKPGHVRGERVGGVLRPLRCHSVKRKLERPQDCWLWLAQEHWCPLLVLQDKVVIWSPKENCTASTQTKHVTMFLYPCQSINKSSTLYFPYDTHPSFLPNIPSHRMPYMCATFCLQWSK